MWTLTKRALTICVLLSGLVTGQAQAHSYAEFGPCTCVWDNTTKDYPPNPKTSGLFSTTVRYSCGYLCLDGEGKTQHVIGQHEVSYSGQEAGNEVICDGMLYEAHENPTGSYNRWLLYFWDGITHPVDARASTSPTLRAWAQTSCAGVAPKASANAAVSFATIDRMRVAVGMTKIKPDAAPTLATPAKLSPDLEGLCHATEVQTAFLKQQIHSSLKSSCAPESNAAQSKNFEALRVRAYHLATESDAAVFARDLNSLLLCPAFVSTPTPAVLRALLDKALPFLSATGAHRSDLAELVCTLGWRGVRSSLLPEAAQSALAR